MEMKLLILTSYTVLAVIAVITFMKMRHIGNLYNARTAYSQESSDLKFKAFSAYMDYMIEIKQYELINLKFRLLRILAEETKNEHFENCKHLTETIERINMIQHSYQMEVENQQKRANDENDENK